MAIKKTIFGSQSERELFVSIDSHWSPRGFVLYPSLPFAAIFDVTRLELSSEERSFLFKTSVDYTLCTKDGRPILSVEFDGISHGFSRHGRYVAIRPAPSNDPRRAWKLDLKVRLAAKMDYPLLVVSYHEKNAVSKDTHLTILDGMIGRVLAKREFQRQLQNLVDAHAAELWEMLPHDASERVQDLAIGLEVELDLEWNPIALAAAKISMDLMNCGFSSSYGTRYLDPPEIPDVPYVTDPNFLKAFEARVAALNRATRIGCRFTYHTRMGDVSADAWVRNTEHAGVSPLGVAEDIAQLLAGQRALKLAGRTGAGTTSSS